MNPLTSVKFIKTGLQGFCLELLDKKEGPKEDSETSSKWPLHQPDPYLNFSLSYQKLFISNFFPPILPLNTHSFIVLHIHEWLSSGSWKTGSSGSAYAPKFTVYYWASKIPKKTSYNLINLSKLFSIPPTKNYTLQYLHQYLICKASFKLYIQINRLDNSVKVY